MASANSKNTAEQGTADAKTPVPKYGDVKACTLRVSAPPASATWGRAAECLDKHVAMSKEMKSHAGNCLPAEAAFGLAQTMFSCGTVVLDDVGAAEAGDVSAHAISEDLFADGDAAGSVAEITAVWEGVKNLLPGDAGRVLRRAYTSMIKDGYPYPGGQGADRQVLEGGPLSLVIWPHRANNIYNIYPSDPVAKGKPASSLYAASLGAELRRLDHLTLRPLAVIMPDCAVVKIEYQTAKKDK
jgi:hypothetical protein